MFDVIGGLPLHPLVVHAAVVLVPLAGLAVLLAGVWPAFRRRAGYVPLLLALLALVLVPIATQSGEAFEERVGGGELVERHAELGDAMLPWVAVLAVVAIAQAWLLRQENRAAVSAGPGATGARPPARWLALALAVAAVVVPVGTIVQTVLVGHSGATAVWSGVANQSGAGDGDSGDSDSDGD